MADNHRLEIVKSPHLKEQSYDFDEIWYTNADLELGDSHVTNFKIHDGRRPPFKKLFLVITQQLIARYQWNFAWGSSFSQDFGSGTDTGIP